MAVEPAALQPAESASQRLSEPLKRKADPIDHPPDDRWLDFPGGDAEFITTRADDSASSQMLTQGSPSIAPAGAESSHAADAGLGRRRPDPPHAEAASSSVPPLASTAGSAVAAAPSASSGSRASDIRITSVGYRRRDASTYSRMRARSHGACRSSRSRGPKLHRRGIRTRQKCRYRCPDGSHERTNV